MTTTRSTERTASDVYESVRALAPTIEERADEIEAARRLPRDLVDQIVDAGCFRLVRPPSHGGVGADWPSALRVFEALARADGSTGWTVIIGAGSWIDLVELPRATFDAIFRDPDTITAGVFNPSGAITPTEDRYRVQGRWAFASGCEHADWIYANAVEDVVDGVPHLRGAVMSPDEVVIEDTWYASGLRGTGSQHFRVDATEVPAERTFVPLAGEPCIDVPIVRIPIPSLFATGVAAIATGVAQGALDDIIGLAVDKVPLLAGGSLASNPYFQRELATADTTLRAARALLWEVAESAWARAVAGNDFTLEDRARIRAAAVWVTTSAAAVVDAAYHAGGSSSVYAESPLQRRWRDVHAITQHFLVKPDTLTTAGAVLAGQEVDVLVF
jgi:alkylation response protein AidB-like acyl-CoA dehydrogenase